MEMEKLVGNGENHIIRSVAEEVQLMLDRSATAAEILNTLVFAAEKLVPKGEVCSILVLDEKGLLRNAASPRLPQDYLTAIDKLKPNPTIGTCAAAAATGKMVITPSFLADNKWTELKHLPMALGYVGAWSMPIKNKEGKVLGTFGTYFKTQRTPGTEEIENIRVLSELAAEVLVKAY